MCLTQIHVPYSSRTNELSSENRRRKKVKTLRKEARAREGKVVREVLRSRDVVLATCVGAATYSLREEEFDLVVIDEAAQVPQARVHLCLCLRLCLCLCL